MAQSEKEPNMFRPPTADITIATLPPNDGREARRLAALDSSLPPRGELLGASVGGELVAVLGIESGELVADPFRRTAELAQLLRMRAAQLAA
jgi:hypothetical protein